MNDIQRPSNALLARALERVAVYRKDPTTLLPYARSMIALADEIERLQRENNALRNLAENLRPGPISEALARSTHEPPAVNGVKLDRLRYKGVEYVPWENFVELVQKLQAENQQLRASQPPGAGREHDIESFIAGARWARMAFVGRNHTDEKLLNEDAAHFADTGMIRCRSAQTKEGSQ